MGESLSDFSSGPVLPNAIAYCSGGICTGLIVYVVNGKMVYEVCRALEYSVETC